MTKSDAREIAEQYLVSLQAKVPVNIAINDAITEEHEAGFVFFYNAADYWRSGDAMDALAGNGPILVRRSGEVAILPTNRSVEASLLEV